MFLMAEKQEKTYNMNVVSHKVNVFHLKSFYHFMKIRCAFCKLNQQCKPVKHKREICAVAHDTAKILSSDVFGKNSSFAYDDFFVHPRNEQETLKIIAKVEKIRKKYLTNNHGNDGRK